MRGARQLWREQRVCDRFSVDRTAATLRGAERSGDGAAVRAPSLFGNGVTTNIPPSTTSIAAATQ